MGDPRDPYAEEAQGSRARIGKDAKDRRSEELKILRAEHAADVARISALEAKRQSANPTPGTDAANAADGSPGRSRTPLRLRSAAAVERDLRRTAAPGAIRGPTHPRALPGRVRRRGVWPATPLFGACCTSNCGLSGIVEAWTSCAAR